MRKINNFLILLQGHFLILLHQFCFFLLKLLLKHIFLRLQQSLHFDRRADGGAPRPDGLLGEHKGAPRLLVRALRRARQPHRERAPHARAPGLDGREHQDGDREERRAHEARRRVRAERSLQRRHASSRCDGHHAGVPTLSPTLSQGRG